MWKISLGKKLIETLKGVKNKTHKEGLSKMKKHYLPVEMRFQIMPNEDVLTTSGPGWTQDIPWGEIIVGETFN